MMFNPPLCSQVDNAVAKVMPGMLLVVLAATCGNLVLWGTSTQTHADMQTHACTSVISWWMILYKD